MLLAYLIPHLDAEIARLQKARDLLASVPDSGNFVSDDRNVSADKHAERDGLFLSRLAPAPAEQAAPRSELAPNNALPSESSQPVMEAAVAGQEAQSPGTGRVGSEKIGSGKTKEPRAPVHRAELRPDRRRRPVILDTALRGPVPAGPIVVSAEEVRKSQAAKTAQATRAAEVKRAGSDFVSSFGWRSGSSSVTSVDALLQRLINIGTKDDRESVSPISSLQQGNSFETARARLVSKLD